MSGVMVSFNEMRMVLQGWVVAAAAMGWVGVAAAPLAPVAAGAASVWNGCFW